MHYLLEVCVDSVESAIAAKKGGADRLEVCSNLIIGGTTPCTTMAVQIRQITGLPMRILIRPRFGDFCYSEYEISQMEQQIPRFLELGAEGVVFGVLTPRGDLHMPHMKRLCRAAAGGKITLHRAFDMCRDPISALSDAHKLGIHTVLTSGGAQSCIQGLAAIASFCQLQERPPELMAGAGVTPDVIPAFLESTDIHSFHMSGKVSADSPMIFRNEAVHMGLPGFSEYQLERTDADLVRQAKNCLQALDGMSTQL